MIILNRNFLKTLCLFIVLFSSESGLSTAVKDNLRLAAICESGITKLYVDEDVTMMSYISKREVYNDYTGKVDTYLKVGKADVTKYSKHDPNSYVFYLAGTETSTSPYEDELFQLDYISMINGEMWIVRINGGNRGITIHNGCQLLAE